MKRGLIKWDKSEIAPEVFERRVERLRRVAAANNLPAVAVYSELWRSNHARFFSNFMPYFNRALLIIPAAQPATLLCGLTPRTYSWIRSVTTIEDVRPAGNFAKPLFELAAERNWTRMGILDLEQLPYDISEAIYKGPLELVNLESASVCVPGEDETELSLRRKAAAIAAAILDAELPRGVGCKDHDVAGRLEGAFRRAGVEDLVTLMTNGDGPPRPVNGAVLQQNYSVSIAVEYRGHWIRLSRPQASPEVLGAIQSRFDELLRNPDNADYPAYFENLGGSYPYESMDRSSLQPHSLFAAHLEFPTGGKRLFYGETCYLGDSGAFRV